MQSSSKQLARKVDFAVYAIAEINHLAHDCFPERGVLRAVDVHLKSATLSCVA